MSNSVSQNLTRLQNARTAIANAITSKGGTVGTNDGYEEFVSDIASIPTATPTFAFLFVTTDSGTTITVSKGQTTLDPQTSVSGEELCFDIPESGTWTVSGSNGKTTTVSITNKNVYYIKVFSANIYGITWDKTNSSPSDSITRTDDASTFSDPNPYYTNMTTTPSSPFDNLMPWSGMEKVTMDNNVMVRIPKFWYKITNSDNSLSIQIADKYVEGFNVSPAHMKKSENGQDLDYVYVGRYKCNTNYKSTSGSSPKVSITRATARSGCKSVGDGYYQLDFAMLWTIRMLYIVEFKNWNCQTTIGYGCGNGSSVGSTGYTDSMTYHTGTTQGTRATYGLGTQYRWIEGLWDNVLEWCDGITFNSSDIYTWKYPSQYSDTYNSTGYIKIGTRHTSSEYITDLSVPSEAGLDWAMYPKHSSRTGSSSTYLCDYCYFNSSGVVLYVGGSYDRHQNYGLGCANGNVASSGSGSVLGVRLLRYP